MIGKGFIVVGVNRSGTSSIAAALRALGVYFGPSEDLPNSGLDLDYDPLENRHIVEIGGCVLRALERDGLPARGMPDGWSEIADVTDRVPEVAKFLEVYFGAHATWSWKDPRTSLLIPFFETVFRQIGTRPTYLMPVRHPLEVAAGLRKRQGLSQTEAIGYWLHYTLSALSALDPERIVLISYADFVADPRKVIEPVCAANLRESPSEADWQQVRAMVHPGLYRTRDLSEGLPPFAAKVWELVSSMSAGADWRIGSSAREQLDALTVEWREWSELTRLSSVRVGEVRWMVAEKMGSLPFRGENEWHPCVIPLPSGARGSIDLWFLPRFRTVRLRNVQFGPGTLAGQTKAAAGESAFAEFAQRGELKLYVFGPTPHLSIDISTVPNVRELRFEFQVSAGKQAVTEVAQRLASVHGAAQSTGPPPRRR